MLRPKRTLSITLSLLLALSSFPANTTQSQTMPLMTPEYLGIIQQKISSHFIYPSEAQAKGWEGVVKVKFSLGEDGRIKDIDIVESSGYPLLDAAAILAIKDTSPYPFPKNYNYKENGELEIILPIKYAGSRPAASVTKTPVGAADKSAQARAMDSTLQSAQAKPSAPLAPKENRLQAKEAKTPLSNLLPLSLIEPLTIKDTPASGGLTGDAPRRSFSELGSFTELALKNNQPTKVAQEEVELAKIKVLEAQRNLFPALKLLGYLTKGQASKINYQEWEAKVQVDQPLFYGGRLGYSVKQALVNYEISQKNYDRLKVDVKHKTETSYYNLIAARMNLAQQQGLQVEAQELLVKMEKLAQAGMVIPLEVNSARSWLEQLIFKISSIKHDLYMAELTFKQVLNMHSLPEIEARMIEPKKLDINLDNCITASLKSRPEIYLSEMLAKFNYYGQKVEAIKNKSLTIDATSSYGNYRGHYVTEPWKSAENWYVGLKASLPWGANTINNSVSSDNQEPRFGETNPNKSSSVTGEINILDNIKRIADKKKADIDLYRSISDLEESFKTVTFEVQDAFLNYQKAVLQLNSAASETKFRRNEAEITKIRSMVGEASLSSAIETLYALSDAHTKYTQALANYQISLANLKKATGYGIQI